MRKSLWGTLGVVCLATACQGSSEERDGVGRISARLTATASTHDVAAVAYAVYPQGQGCMGEPVATAQAALEAEALPPISVVPVGTGVQHVFADSLFVLPPGAYTVCVQPLDAAGLNSARCAPAQGDATVTPGMTTEVLLVSQCEGLANGGLDVITLLNDPPLIENVAIEGSKFIVTCERATLNVQASDPNGDDVTFSYAIVAQPEGASGSIAGNGSQATFVPDLPGTYQIRITATDVFGADTSLVVPIHVSQGDDAACAPIFDFANVPQLYCNGTCGNWGGGDNCQQEDADVFCRLRTGNPASVATSFTVAPALDAPGVCCPPPSTPPGSLGCSPLGVFPVTGTDVFVSVHPTSVASTHGSGDAIISVTCSDPQ